MLLAAFIREAVHRLEALYPGQEARSLALLLCEEMLGVRRYTHLTEPQTEIPAGKLPALQAALDRLAACEPIQYVLGRQLFCGRFFKVSPAVLIPRPETEQLVQMALTYARERGSQALRALDLCTGSGCIAWSLALELPDAQVVATDLSADALALAETQFDAQPAPKFLRSDVLDLGQEFPEAPFDLLLSNPPYIPDAQRPRMHRNVRDYEPAEALFVPDDDPLRFYRAILHWAQRLLLPGGLGIVEIHEDFAPGVRALLESGGMRKVTAVRDIFEKERFVTFCK